MPKNTQQVSDRTKIQTRVYLTLKWGPGPGPLKAGLQIVQKLSWVLDTISTGRESKKGFDIATSKHVTVDLPL